MTPVRDPENRLWRTDIGKGRGVYALVSNDMTKPSEFDPLVGVMESSELAQNVVELHNLAIQKFGRHYLKALEIK